MPHSRRSAVCFVWVTIFFPTSGYVLLVAPSMACCDHLLLNGSDRNNPCSGHMSAPPSLHPTRLTRLTTCDVVLAGLVQSAAPARGERREGRGVGQLPGPQGFVSPRRSELLRVYTLWYCTHSSLHSGRRVLSEYRTGTTGTVHVLVLLGKTDDMQTWARVYTAVQRAFERSCNHRNGPTRILVPR